MIGDKAELTCRQWLLQYCCPALTRTLTIVVWFMLHAVGAVWVWQVGMVTVSGDPVSCQAGDFSMHSTHHPASLPHVLHVLHAHQELTGCVAQTFHHLLEALVWQMFPCGMCVLLVASPGRGSPASHVTSPTPPCAGLIHAVSVCVCGLPHAGHPADWGL